MLTAYFDESCENGEGYYVIGGYLGDDASWRRCTTAWKACLIGAKLESLHLKNMRLGSPKAIARNEKLLGRFAQIPARSGLCGVYGYVRTSDYADLVRDNTAQIAMDGYPLALWPAVTTVVRLTPANERIKFVFEQQIEHATMRELVMSTLSRQPNVGEGASGEKIAGWESVSKSILLEPADYLCYAALQDLTNAHSQKAALTRPILQHGPVYFQHLDREYTHRLITQMRERTGSLAPLDKQQKRNTIETIKQLLAALKRANISKDEMKDFDAAMDQLLKANPAVVKAAMEQEKKEREAERKARRASSAPSSSSRDT